MVEEQDEHRALMRKYITGGWVNQQVEFEKQLRRLGLVKKIGRLRGLDPAIRNKVVTTLSSGPMEFGELQRTTGMNRNILKGHLDELKWLGVVDRKVLPIKGHHVAYSLVGKPVTTVEVAKAMDTVRAGTRWEDKVVPYGRYLVTMKAEEEDEAEYWEMFSKLERKSGELDARELLVPYIEHKDENGKVVRDISVLVDILRIYWWMGREAATESKHRKMQDFYYVWRKLSDDLSQKRVCIECLGKLRQLFRLVPAPTTSNSLETNEAICPNCGVAYQIEWKVEQKTEKAEQHAADSIQWKESGEKPFWLERGRSRKPEAAAPTKRKLGSSELDEEKFKEWLTGMKRKFKGEKEGE